MNNITPRNVSVLSQLAKNLNDIEQKRNSCIPELYEIIGGASKILEKIIKEEV